MRNKNDAYIMTGIIWSFAINLFLISSLNIARGLMADYQVDLIRWVIRVELCQFFFLILLKFISQRGEKDSLEQMINFKGALAQSFSLREKVVDMRKRSCIDLNNDAGCCSTKLRNITFLICTVTFFLVAPTILISIHVAKYSSFETENCIIDEAGEAC